MKRRSPLLNTPRAMLLISVLWLGSLGACSSTLAQGDRSFARGEYLAASSSWREGRQEDADAILFRSALLCTTHESPEYDPDRARELLRILKDRYGRTVYGTAAARGLEWLEQRDVLRTKLSELQGNLDAQSADSAKSTKALAEDREQLAAKDAAIAALEEEKDKLTSQLKALHDGQAGVQALKEDNARLKAEIDELKRIDLRK